MAAILSMYKIERRMQICLRESANCMQRRSCSATTVGELKLKLKIVSGLKILLTSAILILNKAYSSIPLSGHSNLVPCPFNSKTLEIAG